LYEVSEGRAIEPRVTLSPQQGYNPPMTDNTAIVFHGFLNLTNLEKLKLVEIMNDYFDNIPKRESIRDENETRFSDLRQAEVKLSCKCCSQTIS
jgi:hypothetical protein